MIQNNVSFWCLLISQVTSDLLVNSLWPRDTLWWHLETPYGDRELGSVLAQVMAWCLIALSHYLNQWWLSSLADIHLRVISQEMLNISILNMSLKMHNLNIQLHLPGANGLGPIWAWFTFVTEPICWLQILSTVCNAQGFTHRLLGDMVIISWV